MKATLVLFIILVLVFSIEFVAAKILGYGPITRFVLHDLPFRGQSFDKEKWTAAGGCGGLSDWRCVEKEASCLRGPMVRDLLKTHLLVGVTTQEETTALLGPKDSDIKINGAFCDAFHLGMCSGFGFDYDSLYVCYTEQSRVYSAGHLQH